MTGSNRWETGRAAPACPWPGPSRRDKCLSHTLCYLRVLGANCNWQCTRVSGWSAKTGDCAISPDAEAKSPARFRTLLRVGSIRTKLLTGAIISVSENGPEIAPYATISRWPILLLGQVPHLQSGPPADVPRHTALVRVTHWITTLCFLALLVSGVEIVISHPRFYWGETGNVLTPPLFTLPIPASRATVPTGYGYVLPDQNGWSRYLHFQSAWVRGVDRLAVCRLRRVYTDISGRICCRSRRSFAGGRFPWSSRKHLRFWRAG